MPVRLVNSARAKAVLVPAARSPAAGDVRDGDLPGAVVVRVELDHQFSVRAEVQHSRLLA
jgi:hypothetical protein